MVVAKLSHKKSSVSIYNTLRIYQELTLIVPHGGGKQKINTGKSLEYNQQVIAADPTVYVTIEPSIGADNK